MTVHLNKIIILFCVLNITSCKKDLLHVEKIQQINTNIKSELNSIKFIDNVNCIISGGETFKEAVILKSIDGGFTFSANTYPQAGRAMYGSCIAPNGHLYLCGISGTVMISNDTGITWNVGYISNGSAYVGVSFPTTSLGIFISRVLQGEGTITITDTNLNIINEQNFPFGLNEIYMTTNSTGYVIGYGGVLKTTDCGNTWHYQNVSGDNFMAMDIHGDEIWMCGYTGSVYHTTNGGTNWTRVRNGADITLPRYRMLSIVFKDSMNGWAVTDDGQLIHTDDAGKHWAEYDKFTSSSLRSIVLCPNNDLLVAGDNGAIFRITP